jgi:hypothetical protein
MSTPLTPPDSSALATTSAGNWAVQINTTPEATATWAFVNGISKFEPKNKPKMEDDSDIYMDNWASQIAAGQALELSIEGLTKGTVAGGVMTVDPGLAVLLAASKETGNDNIVHLRYWRTDGLPDSFEHRFGVDVSLQGGKSDELLKFTGTLYGRGKPTAVTKPTTP